MSLNRLTAAFALLLLCGTPLLASAQSGSTVRILRATAVLAEPSGTAEAVGTAMPGDVFEVLDQRDGWLLVRPAAGSTVPWRTGWINAASTEPIAGRTPAMTVRQPTDTGEPPSANRKGFIFGVGGGVGMHRAPQFPGFVASPTISDVAVVTDFSIGYAATDQVHIYYSNQVAWSQSFFYNVVGVTGVGVTYMLRRTSPSPFVKATIGAGVAASVDFGTGFGTAEDPGPGFVVSGGYEFARHWSVEGGAMFVRLGAGNNHTVLKATFNWLFY